MDSRRGLSPVRLVSNLAAFSAPAIFALEVPDGGSDWVALSLALAVVGGALIWAIMIQRWRPPMVTPPEGQRRGSDPWPVGPWQTSLTKDVRTRARIWGQVVAVGCLVVAALNAASVLDGGTFWRAAHAVSLAGALILAGFAFRSRVKDEGGTVTEYGTLGDRSVMSGRWREVVVSRVGLVEVWAPQLDDDSPRGYVLGRCARIARAGQATKQGGRPTR